MGISVQRRQRKGRGTIEADRGCGTAIRARDHRAAPGNRLTWIALPALAVLVVLVLAGSASAQYHDPVYVMGGQGPSATTELTGIWLGDAYGQTLTPILPERFYSPSIQMDWDNHSILFAASVGSQYSSGLFRIDPVLRVATTVLVNTQTFWFPRDVVINQDGDYVVPCLQSNQSSVLLKVSRAGQLTTILTTRELSIPADFDGQARVNIDSGHYLIAGTTCVLEVMDNGVARMWSSGPLAGRSSTLPQDFDTGLIEGQYMGIVYRMEQPLTTIKIPGHYLERTCEFDLQSAPKKRWVAIGYQGGVNYEPIEVFYIDKNTHVTMGTVLDPYKNNANWSNHVNAFDFYRGRHLQTVKTGPGAWDVRISCPAFPGKNYVLVPSAAGYRPGLALADGRRVHLNLDGLSYLALFNLLQPYFNPGPLQLDANGEAVGRIDLGKLPVPLPLNLSMWLAVAVLDPAAPCGIAYLPDTYVMWL